MIRCRATGGLRGIAKQGDAKEHDGNGGERQEC